MIRADEHDLFTRFGEIYFSITNPGIVKGWHKQSEQTNILSCISGKLLLVLIDNRGNSANHETMEITLGDGEYKVVVVPPGVIYGWKNIGEKQALLANCASHVHDAAKSEKIALADMPYEWLG